jgi:hypothetical protein
MTKHFCLIAVVFCAMIGTTVAQTPGSISSVSQKDGAGYFPLSVNGASSPLCVSEKEYRGVIRAVKSLQTDIKSVTTFQPEFLTANTLKAKQLVIIGTLWKNPLINRLISTSN